MGVPHVHQASLLQGGELADGVSEAHSAQQQALTDVELLPVFQDLNPVELEPAPPLMRKVNASQLGRLTKSSFSKVRPCTSLRRRL